MRIARRSGEQVVLRNAIVGSLLLCVALVLPLGAQTRDVPAAPTVVHGLYNWVHSTADAERAFAFYRDVLGLALAPSPFVPNAQAPEGIRPWSEVTPDELIWNLTDTRGSRARTVFMDAPNTPFGVELSESSKSPVSIERRVPGIPARRG